MGPVIRPSRMVREIYPEVEQDIPDSSQAQVCIVGDVVYGVGETVPSEQPCLKCSCSPPDVRCETEICVAQPGCKAIHRPNKCCPDYQCECVHEGKSYANGERLPMAPGGECLVCYCRGGEVQCAEVGCYTRNDCKPRYVSGQCCPKYDHCPPRDPLNERATTETLLINSELEQQQITSYTTPNLPLHKYSTLSEQTNNNNNNEEGSGDYTSSSEPPNYISTQSSSQQRQTEEVAKNRPATPVTFSIKEIELKTNNKRTDEKVKIITKTDAGTQTDSENPQITIQEVIPPRAEFIPSSNKQIAPPNLQTIQKESVSLSPLNPVTFKQYEISTATQSPTKHITEDPSNDLLDIDVSASERTEVYDHPPPVIRIGDQLLFINKGQLVPEKDASTPTPIITLIGAEGLQIGLESGELVDQDLVPLNQVEVSSTTLAAFSSSGSISINSKTAEDTSTASSASTFPLLYSTYSTIEEQELSSTFDDSTPQMDQQSFHIDKNISEISTVSSPLTTLQPKEKENTKKTTKYPPDYLPEENPYYPPIPEDIMNINPDESTTDQGIFLTRTSSKGSTFSIASTVLPTVTTVSTAVEEEKISVIPLLQTTNTPQQHKKANVSKILPEVLDIVTNSSLVDNNKNKHSNTNQTTASLEWLKQKNEPTKMSIPLINENAALPESILKMTVPSDLTDDEEKLDFELSPQTKTVERAKVVKPQNVVTMQDKLDKSEKIMYVEAVQASKETIELNDNTEHMDSGEYTTGSTYHSSLMSNEDASVEAIINDSGPQENSNSDMVEIMPGFEQVTTFKTTSNNDEKIVELYDGTTAISSGLFPKDDVELITIHTDKVVDEAKSHAEVKDDFRDEIRKRDVVKKVLKDTFDNPKENIQTDLLPPEDTTDYPDYSIQSNEELNVVKPIDQLNQINTINQINLQQDVVQISPKSSINTTRFNMTEKSIISKTGIVQKVNNNNNVSISNNKETSQEESQEALSPTTLSVLRDFFKTQFKQYHNSKFTD